MKISYNWLKQFINVDWDVTKTGELLTDLGLEVEGIEKYQSVKGGLDGIVVGEVLTCVKHSNADKLKVTTVDIGQEEAVQIVCGAPNVAVGQKVPVATIGTTLYNDQGEAWKIKKGKIRGEESHGMICAEDELGLGDSHDGIMILDANLTPGTPGNAVFDIENDYVFEIGLTPNRADAMSHLGTARDLKAGLAQHDMHPEFITPSTSSFNVENRLQKVEIEVLNEEKAPRYAGLTISGLEVAESPQWLQHRLKAIGLTPINNVVDITNYVLHDLGQPLHAFDLEKIRNKKIVVQTVPSGTKFTTLDGIERELHEDDLMICDEEKPMCIAGVFGGLTSGVTEQTTAIFLESAYFDPVSVRKTAKRHGLNTDASFRFERGIDPNNTVYALKRAAILIQEIAGGKITSDMIDHYPKKIEDKLVVLNFENATKLIGQEIPRETIKGILTSLDIKINNVTETGIGMTIPAYRNDVTREADVIEEILRVYGYNNIEFGNKLNATISNVSKYDDYRLQDIIGNQLTGQGFYEILSNSLTTPSYIELSSTLKEEHNITMLNPLGRELSVMRQSMLFSGLEAIRFNQNRKRTAVKLYEYGKTYHSYNGERQEEKHISLFAVGDKQEESWTVTTKNNRSDFFYLKGVLDALVKRIGVTAYNTSSSKNDCFVDGIVLKIGKLTLAEIGMIKPSILKHFDIERPVCYADVKWDNFIEVAKRAKVKFKAIPKYPAVRRDFALLLDKNIQFDDLYKVAKQTEKALLKNVNLFDVYEGKNLPEGKKSYALSFTLQDENKTLTDKQVDKVMSKLQARFEKEFGASLR